MEQEYYLAFDVETTGQHLTKNALIALGASVIGVDTMTEVDSYFGCYLVPDNLNWESMCVSEFWSKNEATLKEIEAQMIDPRKGMKKFVEWLDYVDVKYGNGMVRLSDNKIGFDYAWVNTYISRYTSRPNIEYKCVGYKEASGMPIYKHCGGVSTHNEYACAVRIEFGDKSAVGNLAKTLGIQNDLYTNDHNALNDARNIGMNYILFKRRCKKRKREYDVVVDTNKNFEKKQKANLLFMDFWPTVEKMLVNDKFVKEFEETEWLAKTTLMVMVAHGSFENLKENTARKLELLASLEKLGDFKDIINNIHIGKYE